MGRSSHLDGLTALLVGLSPGHHHGMALGADLPDTHTDAVTAHRRVAAAVSACRETVPNAAPPAVESPPSPPPPPIQRLNTAIGLAVSGRGIERSKQTEDTLTPMTPDQLHSLIRSLEITGRWRRISDRPKP